MRRVLIVLLLAVLPFLSCVAPSQITIKPVSPGDGSEVPSLSPMIFWASSGSPTSFRLLVASDSNFQQLVVDTSNLAEPKYVVPSGKLKNNTTYYWKVIASKGNSISNWSPAWSFNTPPGESPSPRGVVKVSATVDGVPWSGSINYAINGPFSDTDNSLPWSFADLPEGTYTINYNYGGPSGAMLASITPSPSQVLTSGGTLNFILNFHKQSASSITVNATLDGSPWTGPVNYSLSGPFSLSSTSVPQTFGNVAAGAYTLMYGSGGPGGAVLNGLTPATTQTLSTDGNIAYTLNFITVQNSSVSVTATLNGVHWHGVARYTLAGAATIARTEVPFSLNGAAPGTYMLGYDSGGPPGTSLVNITPSASQVLAAGGNITFNLDYVAQPSSGTIIVEALLDGKPWKVAVGSGAINFAVVGPHNKSSNTVPAQFTGMEAGSYTLVYKGGGPIGATLSSISPSPLQKLSSGSTIRYILNFTGQPKGSIVVNATVNGEPWSGQIGYTVIGPYVESGGSTPKKFSNAPGGTYTIQYRAGGPPSSVFEAVSPPSQGLSPGGTITFTIMFKFKGLLPKPVPEPKPEPVPGPLPEPIPGPLTK